MKHPDLEARRSTWEVPACDVLFWAGKSQEYCLVIPVINEGERIGALLERMHRLKIHEQVDIIIVDGGSTDGSLQEPKLKKLGVRGLLEKKGPGRLSAQLRCAYAFSLEQDYEGIVTIDGNNKDDPDAIPAFVQALQDGVDFAQGSRYVPGGVAENTPKARHLAIRFVHAPLLSAFSGFRWTDSTQGFRAYSRKLLLDPKVAPFRDDFVGYELLAYLSYRAPKLGYRCVELPTVRRYPSHGAVPTKIGGLSGNLKVLNVLFKACAGGYNPRHLQG